MVAIGVAAVVRLLQAEMRWEHKHGDRAGLVGIASERRETTWGETEYSKDQKVIGGRALKDEMRPSAAV